MMFLKSGALVFYSFSFSLLFVGFFVSNHGLVEYGATFFIGGLLLEFISKYINKEHFGE